MLETVEGSNGDVWFVFNGKPILYIDEYGSLTVSGNVTAFGNIPIIPLSPLNNKQTLITDYYINKI
jgi:hypothetical protein